MSADLERAVRSYAGYLDETLPMVTADEIYPYLDDGFLLREEEDGRGVERQVLQRDGENHHADDHEPGEHDARARPARRRRPRPGRSAAGCCRGRPGRARCRRTRAGSATRRPAPLAPPPRLRPRDRRRPLPHRSSLTRAPGSALSGACPRRRPRRRAGCRRRWSRARPGPSAPAARATR